MIAHLKVGRLLHCSCRHVCVWMAAGAVPLIPAVRKRKQRRWRCRQGDRQRPWCDHVYASRQFGFTRVFQTNTARWLPLFCLQAEAAYTKAVLADTEELQVEL